MITKLNDLVGRWLVVDDNPEILQLTCDMLQLVLGVRAEAYKNSATLLAAVQAAPETIELVLTDLEMPGVNGLELCDRLRKICPTLSIVLLTGSALFNDAAVSELGFDGMIRKPYHVGEMVRVINHARCPSAKHLGNLVGV